MSTDETNSDDDICYPLNLSELYQHSVDSDSEYHYLSLLSTRAVIWNLDIYLFLENSLNLEVRLFLSILFSVLSFSYFLFISFSSFFIAFDSFLFPFFIVFVSFLFLLFPFFIAFVSFLFLLFPSFIIFVSFLFLLLLSFIFVFYFLIFVFP